VKGFQTAGVFNASRSPVSGAQIAGVANWTDQPMHGMQAAGAANWAPEAKGVQFAVVNVGGTVDGVQAGVVNIADEVKGMQLGVLNIARSMQGAPIGVVSVIGDGQLGADLWASDTHPVNLAFRFGSKHFYTFLSEAAAEARFTGTYRGYTSAGLGVNLPAGPVDIDVDLSSGTIHENFQSEGLQLLSKLRVGVDRQLAWRMRVFGGLALNSWISNSREVPDFVRLPSRDLTTEGTQVRFWPGAYLGMRL
jgi:hypothetical protein